jgi:hypothetical protein
LERGGVFEGWGCDRDLSIVKLTMGREVEIRKLREETLGLQKTNELLDTLVRVGGGRVW